jgi:hypothetical protein
VFHGARVAAYRPRTGIFFFGGDILRIDEDLYGMHPVV